MEQQTDAVICKPSTFPSLAAVSADLHALFGGDSSRHILASVRTLEARFEQLTIDDLRVLASFPAQPHALLHTLVVCVRVLLLSVASEHVHVQWDMLSWPLVRLQVTTEASDMFHKMWKRWRQVQTHKNLVSIAQIRFVWHYLHRFCESETTVDQVIESYARVSVIAASLGAWTLLCLRLSLLPLSFPLSPRSIEATKPFSPSKSTRIDKLMAIDQSNQPSTPSTKCRGLRMGLKIGSRYVLFHTQPATRVRFAQWSVLRLASFKTSRRNTPMALMDDWKPWQLLDPPPPSSLPPLAMRSWLLQSSYYAKRFEFLSTKYQMPLHSSTFVLKLVVLCVNSDGVVQLIAIGNAMVSASSTVRQLRTMLTPKLPVDHEKAWSFLYRNARLPQSMEKYVEAMALLPLAFVTLPSKKKKMGKATEQYLRFVYQQLTMALLRSGIPNHMPQGNQPLDLELYRLRQMLLGRLEVEDLVILMDFLVNWRVFVDFQLLQKSILVYEAQEEEPVIEEPPPPPPPEEPRTPQLPLKRFDPKTEYLLPLYASAMVESTTSMTLTSPFLNEVYEQLQHAMSQQETPRLAISQTLHVIHLQHVELQESSIRVEFQRDRSTNESKLLCDGAFMACTWIIDRQHVTASLRHENKQWITAVTPPRWQQEIWRLVTHPTLDFDVHDLKQSYRFFHVRLPFAQVEQVVELTCWSRTINWSALFESTEFELELLQLKYRAMVRSHPPGFAVDSVKFGKFVRECSLQPSYITIGDVAFLFARHCVPGSASDMIWDGFLRAVQSIATQLYPPPIPHTIDYRLKYLLLDLIISAPSMRSLWEDRVRQWRLSFKIQHMESYARHYCAATRIQAAFRGRRVHRIYRAFLERKRRERRAAIKIQALGRMRKHRKAFQHRYETIRQVQRRVKARHVLRVLRRERKEFVERKRVEIVRWMRQRLRVLRMWKILNEKWVARRDRIRAKRKRRLVTHAYMMETRRLRFALYRPEGADPVHWDTLELELLDPQTSIGLVLPIAKTRMENLDQSSGNPSVLEPFDPERLLQLLVRRLWWRTRPGPAHYTFHNIPIETSLGKLVFRGVVRTAATDKVPHVDWHRVRLLQQHLDLFVVLIYSPSLATLRCFSISTSFMHRALQFQGFQDWTLPEIDDGSDEIMYWTLQPLLYRDPSTQQTMMCALITYLTSYDTTRPCYAMIPQVIAAQQQQAIEELQRQQKLERARMHSSKFPR